MARVLRLPTTGSAILTTSQELCRLWAWIVGNIAAEGHTNQPDDIEYIDGTVEDDIPS